MKGVILAGGRGTRLYPLTGITNKHLLPVGREPMVFHAVRQLIKAGIRDILVISGPEHVKEMVRILGSGQEMGCRFTFRIQEEALGIAHGLLLAEDFAAGGKIAVLLGDNIATHSIKPYAERFKRQTGGARVLLKEVDDPRPFGMAVLDGGSLVRIVEKPDCCRRAFVVVGIYFYDSQVFDLIRETSRPVEGEWGITPVNNAYLARGQLTYDLLEGEWVDAGTFPAYRYANRLLTRSGNKIIDGEER